MRTDMSVKTIIYLWRDIKRPENVKFGDHTIAGNPTQTEIEVDTKAYIRKEMKRQKYVFDAGDIEVLWIKNITEYAQKVGKNYPHAKIDDFIANEKPLYCKIKGKTYFPILKQYAVDLGLSKWDTKFYQTPWQDHDYESVIMPLIPYSHFTLDNKNVFPSFGNDNKNSFKCF